MVRVQSPHTPPGVRDDGQYYYSMVRVLSLYTPPGVRDERWIIDGLITPWLAL